MVIEFRKADSRSESEALARFDRRVFGTDAFPKEQWREYEAWWMVLGRKKIGCCAFKRNADFQPDVFKANNPRLVGSLYIASTGMLEKFRGNGFGKLLKSWQIAYARYEGFKRIVTNSRRSNKEMIQLNRSFGFRRIGIVPKYHVNPEESTVVMELRLEG